jgi:titin
VDVFDAPGTMIGGTAAGAGNVISGNGGDGVDLEQVSGAVVQGNFIGTTADGSHPLDNAGNGVVIDGGASNNTVGGAGAGNIISANGKDGVLITEIFGSAATGNQVVLGAGKP